MGIVAWLVVGAIAGWLGSKLMGKSTGLLMNIILGIIGASIGGAVMNLIGKTGVTGFNLYSILVSVLGAIIIIFVANRIK